MRLLCYFLILPLCMLFACQTDSSSADTNAETRHPNELDELVAVYNESASWHNELNIIHGAVVVYPTLGKELYIYNSSGHDIILQDYSDNGTITEPTAVQQATVIFSKRNAYLQSNSGSLKMVLGIQPELLLNKLHDITFTGEVFKGSGLIHTSGIHQKLIDDDIINGSLVAPAFNSQLKSNEGGPATQASSCKCYRNVSRHEPGKNPDDCDSGGDGSTGCSIGDKLTEPGCSVSCNGDTHFACCEYEGLVGEEKDEQEAADEGE